MKKPPRRMHPQLSALLDSPECRSLSESEERDIFQQVADGIPGARNRAINHNLRLAMKFASTFPGDLEDNFGAASLGIVEAVDHFDLSRGCRFSTYASKIILKHLYLHVAGVSTIAIPIQAHWDLLRLDRAEERGEVETVRTPDFILESCRASRRRCSLRAEGGIVHDDQFEIVAERETKAFSRRRVRELLATLELRDAHLLCLYHGLYGFEPMNFAEISRAIGMCRERSRQIYNRALSRIRSRIGEEHAPAPKPSPRSDSSPLLKPLMLRVG